MITVTFKLSEAAPVSLAVSEPQPLRSVLEQAARHAGIELGGYIAVCNGRVITGEELVAGDDSVEVFPAISGG